MCKSNQTAIGKNNFKLALKALGLELPRDQYIKLISRIQKDKNGLINKEIFIKEVQEVVSQTDDTNDMIKAFRLFDEDDTGKIDFNNLKNVAKFLGEQVSDQEIINMLNSADNDGDGQVSLTEFIKLIDRAKKVFNSVHL